MMMMIRPWLVRASHAQVARHDVPICRTRLSRQCQLTTSSSRSPKRPRRRAERLQGDASLAFAQYLVTAVAVLSGGISAVIMAQAEASQSDHEDTSEQIQPVRRHRFEAFELAAHNYKHTARFVKVDHHHNHRRQRRDSSNNSKNQEAATSKSVIHDYTVHMTLVPGETTDSGDGNTSQPLAAADESPQLLVQRLAAQYHFDSPEEIGMLVAQCLLLQYAWLECVVVHVDAALWDRAVVDGQPQSQGFVQHHHGSSSSSTGSGSGNGNLHHHATVHLERGQGPMLSSSLSGLVLLKSVSQDQCLSTRLEAAWTYAPMSFHQVDYCVLRNNISKLLQKGFFEPPSQTNDNIDRRFLLQATLYDAACLVLSEEPHVQSVSLYATDRQFVPIVVGDAKQQSNGNVYIPAKTEPALITCTVNRGNKIATRRPSLLGTDTGSDAQDSKPPRPVRLQPQRSKLPQY